ncbi:MAG: hypothetical protein IPO83_16175 [Chitinophagaceae bacterium]|nr:hypothetical protein [Chitinophagaceae bacterium]
MEKEIWRERWLDCINELTSLNLQKKAWLDKANTNPHWSFVEFCSCYFDDLNIDDNYKYSIDNGWITGQEYEIIKDWHEALNRYNAPNNENHDHEAILKLTKRI